MKVFLILLLHFTVLAGVLCAQPAIKDKVANCNLLIKVKNDTTLEVTWGKAHKIIYNSRTGFDTSSECNSRPKMYVLQGKDVLPVPQNLYKINDSNVCLVLQTGWSFHPQIMLLGLMLQRDSIFLYKNASCINEPLVFTAGSILVAKQNNTYHFIANSKMKSFEYADTSYIAYTEINLFDSWGDGKFHFESHFSMPVDYPDDQYEDEGKFYRYILSRKQIMNPLALQLLEHN